MLSSATFSNVFKLNNLQEFNLIRLRYQKSVSCFSRVLFLLEESQGLLHCHGKVVTKLCDVSAHNTQII